MGELLLQDVRIERLSVRPRREHLRVLAHIHESELAAGFVAQLGMGFLEVIYRHICTDRGAILIAAFRDDHVVGFVSGTVDARAFYRSFARKRALRSLFHVLPRLVSRPSTYRRIVSLRRHMVGNGSCTLPAAELLSIAVRSDVARLGVGRCLFHALCDDFRLRGIRSFKVASADTQVAAQGFFGRLGGTVVETRNLGSLKSNVYLFPLDDRGVEPSWCPRLPG